MTTIVPRRRRWSRLTAEALLKAATTFSLYSYQDSDGRWHDYADVPGVCDRCGGPPVNGDRLRRCGGHLMCRSCRMSQMSLRGWSCPTCPDDERPQWRADLGEPVQ